MTGLSFEPARWPCDICKWMPNFERLCLYIFIRMADGLVSICARSDVILDIGLHEVYVQVSVHGCQNQIFADGYFTKFS